MRRWAFKRLLAQAGAILAALILGLPTGAGSGADRNIPVERPLEDERSRESEERSEQETEERTGERTGSDEDPVVWQLNQQRSRHVVRHDGATAIGVAPDTRRNKTNSAIPSTSSAAEEFRNGIGCPLRC